MTTPEFKDLWPAIKGKKVNLKYGKQVFRSIVLTEYNEKLKTVKTEMKGELNTVAIREIFLIPVEMQADVLEVPAEEFTTAPKMPPGWKQQGYFLIYGTFAGNWKKINQVNQGGKIEEIEFSSFYHSAIFKKIAELKKQNPKNTPDLIIDETFLQPVFYMIESGNTIKIIDTN